MEEIHSCFDSYCRGAGVSEPFCNCWVMGLSIDMASCYCVEQNFESVCDEVDLDEVRFDCALSTNEVAQFCN